MTVHRTPMNKLPRLFVTLGILAVVIASSALPLHAYTVAEMKLMQGKVEQLVAKNTPAVVSLLGETIPGAGSGTIVAADGLILTAAHVTRGNAKMTVIFPDGHSLKGTVLGANYTSDVGLLKIDAAGTYPFVEIGDSDLLEPTTMVVAMGHPGGFDLRRTPPVRIGRINQKNPSGFLMSDCTLVGGDSGGPLFDIEGRIVGIHSSISESLTFNRHAPVNAAKKDWQKLLASEHWGTLPGEARAERQRAMLGAVLDPTPQDGVALKEVPPNSPAAEAGLRTGDVIVKFNGRSIRNADQLKARLSRSRPGKKVELAYRRADTAGSASVTLVSEDELKHRMGAIADATQPPDPATKTSPETATPPKPAATGPLAELLDKLRSRGRQNGSGRELHWKADELEGLLREALAQQDVARDKLKTATLPELLQLTQERNPNAAQTLNFEGLEPLRDMLVLMDPKLQGKLEDQFHGMLDGYRPGCGAAAKATFVLRDAKHPHEPVGLAACVQADGWLLTKASDVAAAAELECLVHDEWLAAKIAHTWQEHDLALVKITARQLPTVTWSTQDPPAIGAFIAAVSPEGEDPAAIGLVSVATRCLQDKGRGFLGVQLEADAQGVSINEVVAGGAAAKSDVHTHDRVLEVDGTKPDTIYNFTKLIAAHNAGEKVKLKLQRGDAVIEKEIALGDRGAIANARGEEREDKMESMGSTLSKRKGNFATVLQSDFPLDANQCGGPVTDLDGNVVGLVIARAGRVETLVLPSTTLRDVLASVDFTKEAAALP